MPRVVLIGGPADGMRKFVDQPYPILKVAMMQPVRRMAPFDSKIPIAATDNTVAYEWLEFYGIGFYAHVGMKRDLLIQKLLAGYYPNE